MGTQRRIGLATTVVVLVALPVLWAYRPVVPLEPLVRLLLPWLWLALWTGAALGAGYDLVRACQLRPDAPVAAVLVLAVGAVVLASAATALSFAGLVGPWSLGAVLAAALIRAAVGRRQASRLRWPGLLPVSPLGLPLAAALVVVFATLSAPPVMYDSLHYHLAFPAQWLLAGGTVELPRQAYSAFPATVGALYLYPLALLGPWAAKAVHAWFGILTLLAGGALAHRLGGRHAARWSVLLLGLTPAFLELAGYAMVDLAVAGWAGAAVVALVAPETWRLRPGGRVVLAGGCVGAAICAKYLALATVLVPVAGAVVAATLATGRGPRRAAALGVLFAAAVVVVASPWYGRNLVLYGNPVYPFAQGLFGGPPVDLDATTMMAQDATRPTGAFAVLGHALAAPVVRTFAPLQAASGLGPQWLILLPGAVLLARSRSAGVLWLVTGVGALCWGALLPFGRFLLPALVPASALAGVAAARLTGRHAAPAVRRATGFLIAAVLAWNGSTLATSLTLERIATTVGVEPETALLQRWVSYWPVVETIQRLPADAGILLVGEPRSLYLDHRVVVEDPNRTPLLLELAENATDLDDLAAAVAALGVSYALVNEGEMSWLAGLRGRDDYWSPASERARALVRRFLAERLVRLDGNRRVWVGRLVL